MQKNLLFGLVIALVAAFFLYQHNDSRKPLGPREALESQIEQISKTKELTADEENLFRLQMAIMDFTTKNSAPPDSLTQLVPTYFDELPLDPATGQPYRYKRSGNRPLLGDMIDRAEGRVVAKASKPGAAATLSNEEDFINPNEMELEKFVYDSTDRRDPFQPFDLAPKKSEDDTRTPLERFGLGQLRLTAVLSSTEGFEPTAIVETAEGKGYTVKPGTKIGTNNGVVVSIEADRLKILETVTKFTGEEEQKVEELILQVGKADSSKSDSRRPNRR